MPLHLLRISLLQIGQFVCLACHRSMHCWQKACKQGSIVSLGLSRQIEHSPIGSLLLIDGEISSLLTTSTFISASFSSSYYYSFVSASVLLFLLPCFTNRMTSPGVICSQFFTESLRTFNLSRYENRGISSVNW